MPARLLVALILACAALPAAAKDVIQLRTVSLELARDLAQAAVEACREQGYQVSAVVVNRAGDPQVVLRDSLALKVGMTELELRHGISGFGLCASFLEQRDRRCTRLGRLGAVPTVRGSSARATEAKHANDRNEYVPPHHSLRGAEMNCSTMSCARWISLTLIRATHISIAGEASSSPEASAIPNQR